jgi:hypothetical protein
MKRFFKPYYIFNILLILVYPSLRLIYHVAPRLQQLDTMGYSKENGIIFTSIALLYVQWRKSTTTDQFLSNILFVGKLTSAILLLFANLRIAMFYLLACFCKSSPISL